MKIEGRENEVEAWKLRYEIQPRYIRTVFGENHIVIWIDRYFIGKREIITIYMNKTDYSIIVKRLKSVTNKLGWQAYTRVWYLNKFAGTEAV
jgi:hypothetical protein